jgi:hypothetical protein
MSRHFVLSQRMSRLASSLAQKQTRAEVKWGSSPKIGQRECGLTVPTVSGSEKRKQLLILIDGKQLTVTKRPPLGRESPGDHFDLTYVWNRHAWSLLVLN